MSTVPPFEGHTDRELLHHILATVRLLSDDVNRLRHLPGQLDDVSTKLSHFREVAMPILTTIRENIMATQADVDAVAAQLTSLTGAVNTGVTDLTDEIAALSAAHPDLDLSGVQTALDGLTTGIAGVTALDQANAPAPAPTPVDPNA